MRTNLRAGTDEPPVRFSAKEALGEYRHIVKPVTTASPKIDVPQLQAGHLTAPESTLAHKQDHQLRPHVRASSQELGDLLALQRPRHAARQLDSSQAGTRVPD